MKNNISFCFLFFSILFFSCNMGKHYADMRASHHDSDHEESILAEEIKFSNQTTEIKKDSISFYEVTIANSPSANVNINHDSSPFERNRKKVDFIPYTFAKDKNQKNNIQEPFEHFLASKISVGYTDAFQGTAIFLIFILPILIALIVFLISWIFVAPLIALRIALWTLAGIALIEILLLIFN